MLTRYAAAVALASLLAACARGPLVPPCDGGGGGDGGAGGAPETAYPCGFPGSAKLAECNAVIHNGVAYCGHAGPVERPFADCVPMRPDADAGPDDWDWWCCPYGDAGTAMTFDAGGG